MSIFNIFKPIQKTVRRFFRQRMMPMSVDEAEEKREFFAKLYFMSAFCVFACTLYSLSKKRMNNAGKTVPIAEETIEKLKIDGNVRILTFEGFKKVDDYYYTRKENQIKENETNSAEQKQNLDPELIVESIQTDQTEAF